LIRLVIDKQGPAYGGAMGELSSIDQDGFASAAFHAFPYKLASDP
jgi:hypothetical protein